MEKIDSNNNTLIFEFDHFFNLLKQGKEGVDAANINTIQIIKNNQNFLKLDQDVGVKLINNLTMALSKVTSNKEWLARNNKKITGINVLVPSEFLAYAFQESGGNPSVTGKSGERGLFQIKPPLGPKDAQQQYPQDRKAYAESYETYEWLNNIGVISHSIDKLDDVDFSVIGLTRFLESKRSQLFALDKLNQTQTIEKQKIQITQIDPNTIERLLPLVHNRGSIVQGIIRNIYQTTGKLPVTLWGVKKRRYGTSDFDKTLASKSAQFDNLIINTPKNAVQTDLVLEIKKPQNKKDIVIFEKLFSTTYDNRSKTHPDGKYTIPAKNRIITTKYIEQVNGLRKQFEK